MKQIKIILKLLLISLLISGSYGSVILLLYGGGWYGSNVLAPLIIFIPFLCITLLHHFYIRKRFKILWQQYLAAIGFFLPFYFFSRLTDNIITSLLSVAFLTIFGITMQWLDMLLFTEVTPKNRLSRFMKFFITILVIIFFLDIYINYYEFIKIIYANNIYLLKNNILLFFCFF